MADVITRFKLETTQYDSKLRDASRSLADLTHQLSMAGKDFERFAKEHVQTAASLGQVASGAANLKDKLKDLVGAYNTAARAYNSLTKEQQSGDFGKAMAASLQKLQQDITQTKSELYNIGEQSKGTGGIMDQLASKFTLNIDAMKLFNVGLQAAQGALSVVKDAFFNNEEQLDEWGRVVESSQSLYEGFLNALNTGDISGYIDNIGNIIKTARDAYDALDALNTFNAFNQINVEKTRTGMTEAIVDYREGNSTKEAVKASGEAYKKELQERQRLERDAYLKAVSEMAAKRGVSAKDLTDALSGTYGHYQDLKKVQPTGERIKFYGNSVFGGGGYYTEKFAQNDRERLGEALRRLNDTELQSLQALGAQAERTGNEIAGVDRQLVRVLNGRQGTGGSGSTTVKHTSVKPEEILPIGSVAALNEEISKLQKEQQKVTSHEGWEELQRKINNLKFAVKDLKNGMSSGVTFSDAIHRSVLAENEETKTHLNDKNFIGDSMKGLDEKVLTTIAERQAAAAKNVQEAWKHAAGAVGLFGNVLGALKDPAAQIGATVAQAIASVALAYADTLAKDKTTKSNIWAFIAASAAAMVSMGTTIAQIHSSTGYASGGVIPGNSFSGDNQWVRVNAGETILTEAQSGVLASRLQNNTEGFVLETAVRGDDLRLILRRGNMKRGHGSRNLVL